MKFIDVLLIVVIAAALALAARHAWRNRGKTCDGSCAGCGACEACEACGLCDGRRARKS